MTTEATIVWGVPAMLQKGAFEKHCTGDCGKISMGGVIDDPVTGGLFVCCQPVCPAARSGPRIDASASLQRVDSGLVGSLAGKSCGAGSVSMSCQRSRCSVKLAEHAQEPVAVVHTAGHDGCLASAGRGDRRGGTTTCCVTRCSHAQPVSGNDSSSSVSAQILDSRTCFTDNLLCAVDDGVLARSRSRLGLGNFLGLLCADLRDLAVCDHTAGHPATGDQRAAYHNGRNQLRRYDDHLRPACQSRQRRHSA